MRHKNFELWIEEDDGSDLFQQDSSFVVRNALSGSETGISLESVNYPGYYLRHAGYKLYLNQLEEDLPEYED
jgi:hypothetical protein